jgi:hypothetical protein
LPSAARSRRIKPPAISIVVCVLVVPVVVDDVDVLVLVVDVVSLFSVLEARGALALMSDSHS